MTNEYTKPEVLEIGEATEVILGRKEDDGFDDVFPTLPHSDLDD